MRTVAVVFFALAVEAFGQVSNQTYWTPVTTGVAVLAETRLLSAWQATSVATNAWASVAGLSETRSLITNAWNFVVDAKRLTREERDMFNAKADASLCMLAFGVSYGGSLEGVANEVRTLDLSREIDELEAKMERTRAKAAAAEEVSGEFRRVYAKGVNDALDAAMLLDLEQSLEKGEPGRMTWGEAADAVRRMLGVEKQRKP